MCRQSGSTRSRRPEPRTPGLGLLLLLCTSTAAQSAGLPADRFAPAPGPDSFVQVEGAALPRPGQLAATAALWTASRPLVLRGAYINEEIAVPVEQRVALDLGADLGIWRGRLALGLGLPLVLWQAGDRLARSGGPDAAAPLDTTVVGDLRLRAKAQLYGSRNGRLALAGLSELTLPAGGRDSFAGRSSVTVALRGLLTAHRGRFSLGLAAAARFGPREQLYQSIFQHAFEWGVAVGLELLRRPRLLLIGEATGVLGFVGPFPSYPVEAGGALRIGNRRLAVDLGAGAGMPDAALTPRWRAFVLFRATSK